MDEGVNVANAYVQVMPSFRGAEQTIASALGDAAEPAGKAAGSGIGDAILSQLGGLGERFARLGGDVGTSLFSGIRSVAEAAGPAATAAAAVACGTAVGSALQDIGAEFDDMSDTIVVGTGASGDALAGLESTAKQIATTVPTSFSDAADTVQFFNTRMGMTGDDLAAVGERVAAVGSMMGESVDLDRLTGAFNAFGVSNDEAASKLDYMFGVAQSTGIGFNELTGVIQSSAPAMTQLGFSYEETANMAGLLSKAGMDASGMMGKMSKGLMNLQKPGESARDAFGRVTDQIQGYIDSGDQASALDLASSIFGTKGAAQFVAAVQSGTMSMDALADSALGASGDILETHEATADWPETWELIQNRVSAALEPFGSAVFSGISTTMTAISGAMDLVWQASEPLRDSVGSLADGALSKLRPVLDPVISALGQLGGNVGPLVSALFSALSGILDAAGAAFSALFGFVSPVVAVLAGALSAAIQAVGGVLGVLSGVLTGVGQVFEAVSSAIMAEWSAVAPFFSGVTSTVQSLFSPVGDFIGSVFERGRALVDAAVTAIVGFVSSIPGNVSSFLSGIPDLFSGAFSNVSSFASDAVGRIVDVVSGLPGRVWEWISSIPGKFSEMFSSIHVPTFHIEGEFNLDPANFSVPHLAFYGAGGFIDRPTAIVGERGGEFVWPSYDPYMTRYAESLAEQLAPRVGAGQTINVYQPVQSPDELARVLRVQARHGLAAQL